MPLPWPKKIIMRMQTRDLFALGNLVMSDIEEI